MAGAAPASARARARSRTAARLAPLALACLLLSGCVSSLLYPPAASSREAACAFLRPDQHPHAVLRVEVAADAPPLPAGALEAAAAALRAAMGRTPATLRTETAAAGGGTWDSARLAAWAEDEPARRHGTALVRVLWAGGGGQGTGFQVGPGAVFVDAGAVLAGAQRLGRSDEDVARAVLLHHVGHALGLVNRGIPVQSPRLQEREGPPGHEPDPASVLAAAWEDPDTMTWVEGATYDAYSPGAIADWRAARNGVCA